MTSERVDPIDELVCRADEILEFVTHCVSAEGHVASRERPSLAEWIAMVGHCLGHACGPHGTLELDRDAGRAASWLASASALSVRAQVELAPTDSRTAVHQDALVALRLRVIGAVGFWGDTKAATQLVELYQGLGEIAALADPVIRREENPLMPQSPLAPSLWSMFHHVSFGPPDPLAEIRERFAAFAGRSAALAAALHPGGRVDAPPP